MAHCKFIDSMSQTLLGRQKFKPLSTKAFLMASAVAFVNKRGSPMWTNRDRLKYNMAESSNDLCPSRL